MSSASGAVSLARLKRRALSIGAVKAFDHAMQFLLPLVLVRCLDTATFGEYRLLWLAVGTTMSFATLNMCNTLYYFVPRSEPQRKRLYVHQTLLFLAVSGLVCAFFVSPANPLLPAAIRPLEQHGALVPVFVALWIVASLLDRLPTVDERIAWQAYATVGVSALRVALTAAGAWFTGDFHIMLSLLTAVVLVKTGLLAYYVGRRHGLGRPWFEWSTFSEQFRHSAPLGLNAAFYSFRGNADQWVAATLFSLTSFAAFSVAAVVGQLVYILRQSVMESFLPSMSRLQAAGNVRGMLDMNSRGNVMVGKLLYPGLAFVFVFAPELVTMVYTASYSQAAPVMRVYIIGMLASVVEMGSLVMLLRQGTYALGVTAVTLAVSITVSWIAAHFVGLPGAAAGSVLALYLDRILVLRRVARQTGVRLRELQDWRTLATQLAFAAVSALLAWFVAERLAAAAAPPVRVAIGAAVFALLFAVPLIRRSAR
ncbi:MAG TPA: oligosaccharide flippase family protein [Burkholderiales bacterium]